MAKKPIPVARTTEIVFRNNTKHSVDENQRNEHDKDMKWNGRRLFHYILTLSSLSSCRKRFTTMCFIIIIILFFTWQWYQNLFLDPLLSQPLLDDILLLDQPSFPPTNNSSQQQQQQYGQRQPRFQTHHHNNRPHDGGNNTDPCLGYDGILHIAQGDIEGAAATIFYFFVLNQLLYAERFNLLPWIHLNHKSHWVYDETIHGGGGVGDDTGQDTQQTASLSFPMIAGRLDYNRNHSLSSTADDDNSKCPPVPIKDLSQYTELDYQTITVKGNGVWSSYFEPVSNFNPWLLVANPNHTTCSSLPLIRLSLSELLTGLHLNCPYTVRAWRYGGISDDIRQPFLSLRQWLQPNRQMGASMVHKYYRPKPYIWKSVQQALQSKIANSSNSSRDDDDGENDHSDAIRNRTSQEFSSTSFTTTNTTKINTECLAMHIRHSDKANHRKRLKLVQFLPYVQVYLQQLEQEQRSRGFVYLATDSSLVIQRIQETWPPSIVQRIRAQSNVLRSPNRTAVFQLATAVGSSRNQDENSNDSRNSSWKSEQRHHRRTKPLQHRQRLGGGHHRTNVEVLVDGLAMSHCQFLLHGLSAVSESTIFWNLELHNHSVNLEDPNYMSVQDFEQLVIRHYSIDNKQKLTNTSTTKVKVDRQVLT